MKFLNPIHFLEIVLLIGCIGTPVRAQDESPASLGLIPKPVSVERKPGVFTLTGATRILGSPGCESEEENLSRRLNSLTGIAVKTGLYDGGQVSGPAIILHLQPAPGQPPGAEGYRLSVHEDKVVIEASTTSGIFYGGITLTQLASPPSQSGSQAVLPCVEITDYPRFAWRGMMLDCARHFQPKAFIERFLDLMAMEKFNRFHWHLVDSEGWRLEIKKYPKLTQVCADAPATYPSEDPEVQGPPMARYHYGAFHGGGYYTQEDVREILAYAAARHITVMPEIEFPAHSMAALTAYPEFSTTGTTPNLKSNISNALYNVDDKSLQFLKDILSETMALFPGEYLHFGGDEAPKGQWKASAFVQAKIKELGLKDEDALQSWMFEQMAEYVGKQGRRAVGWEEITKGGIPKDAIVMPWIGMKRGVDAANAGNDIIIAIAYPNYFNRGQADGPGEPALPHGGNPLNAVYAQTFEYPAIQPECAKHILGAQGELWGEALIRPRDVEYQVFPRAAALAEALWTPLAEKDFADFSKRLVVMAKRWDRYSPPVNYHFLTPGPFAQWTPEVLKASNGILEYPISSADDLAAVSTGSCGVIFQYSKGAEGLAIQKVELLADGKVIAADTHDGFTGNKKQGNIYFLTYPELNTIRYTSGLSLRVTRGKGGPDSYGDVTLIGGEVVGRYRPR